MTPTQLQPPRSRRQAALPSYMSAATPSLDCYAAERIQREQSRHYQRLARQADPRLSLRMWGVVFLANAVFWIALIAWVASVEVGL